MTKKKFTLIVLFLCASSNLCAETFTLDSGETVEGIILDQNNDFYYVDTQDRGVVSIPKKDSVSNADTGAVQVSYKKIKKHMGFEIKEPPVANPIVRVGKGGITEDQYQQKLKVKEKTKSAVLTEEEKKQALEESIGDEILLQELLKGGIHSGFPHQNIVIKRHLETEIEKANAGGVSEETLKQYYETHQEKYRSPSKILYFIYIASGPKAAAEAEQAREEAIKDPANYTQWGQFPMYAQGSEPGWIREDLKIMAGRDEAATIRSFFKLKKGEISPVLPWGREGLIFCYVKDKVEGTDLSYAEARDTVVKDFTQEKIKQSAPAMENEEQSLFMAALKAGIYRDEEAKDSFIDNYLHVRQLTRAQALNELRPKYRVEILTKDLS